MKFFLAPLEVLSALGTMVAVVGSLILMSNSLVYSKMHYFGEVAMWQWFGVMMSLDSEHCPAQTTNK
jgi:hypothetical protein